MELQSFISSNIDYVDKLKKNGFKTKKFSKYNLLLIKYPYDKKINTDTYERYCRGAIVDLKENKLKMIPPCKSDNLDKLNLELSVEYEIEELHDGSMINIFYHNNEWLMSTRSDIGCNNRWNNRMSFREMFQECVEWSDFNHLHKNYCYSFLMKHKNNRNISIIDKNEVILVEVYDMNTMKKIKIDGMIPSIKTTDLNKTLNKLKIDNFNTFSWKGITLKVNDKRYNYINELFTQVELLNVNSNNKLYNFIKLKKEGNLLDYLNFYPEYKKQFYKYNLLFNKMINELHDTYKSIFIYKTLDKSDCYFQFKPLIFKIHKNYLQTKENTTKLIIKKYVMSLDVERLVFILKYYL